MINIQNIIQIMAIPIWKKSVWRIQRTKDLMSLANRETARSNTGPHHYVVPPWCTTVQRNKLDPLFINFEQNWELGRLGCQEMLVDWAARQGFVWVSQLTSLPAEPGGLLQIYYQTGTRSQMPRVIFVFLVWPSQVAVRSPWVVQLRKKLGGNWQRQNIWWQTLNAFSLLPGYRGLPNLGGQNMFLQILQLLMFCELGLGQLRLRCLERRRLHLVSC